MTERIEVMYQRALLADVAYIDLRGLYNSVTGQIIYDQSNTDALTEFQKRGLTEAQFLEFRRRYEIIDHVPNDAFGFSATLFRDKDNGNKPIVAFRGTETSSPLNVATDVLIQDVFGVFIGFSSLLGQSNSGDSAFQRWIDAGYISESNQATVVGHSLGGHLSLMAGAEYDALIDSVFTFNGAGLNGWDALFNLSDITASKVTRVVSETGYEVTASDVFLCQVGQLHEIAVNRQPLAGLLESWFSDASLNHHYMVHLVDSLSVMRVLTAM